MLFIWLLDGAWGMNKNVSVSKSSLQTRGKKGQGVKLTTMQPTEYWWWKWQSRSCLSCWVDVKLNKIKYWKQFILIRLNIRLKRQKGRPNWWLGKEYYFHSTFWNEAFYKNCSELWAIQELTKIAFNSVQPLLCSAVGFWIGC